MKNTQHLTSLSRADLKAIHGGGKAYRNLARCSTNQRCIVGGFDCWETSGNPNCKCLGDTPTSALGRCAVA